MVKRFQNKVAESRYTLPAVLAYAIAVWLSTGLLIPHIPISGAELGDGAWVQLVCFVVSTYLMIELNNSNALIRIYSRMVSCSFIAMCCACCFLFSSTEGAIAQLCVIAAYTTIFRTYQHKQSVGWTFYAFLCLSLASTVVLPILWYVPLFWLLMRTQLNSLSWRTFFSSVVGLVTPYWFCACVLLFMGDITLLAEHFCRLADLQLPSLPQASDLSSWLQPPLVALPSFVLLVVLCLTGTIHYWRNRSDDKIRIRQFYGWFMWVSYASMAFLAVQPQYYDLQLRMLIINVSPLAAHFFSLTSTRITNIAFYCTCVAIVLLTAFALLSFHSFYVLGS